MVNTFKVWINPAPCNRQYSDTAGSILNFCLNCKGQLIVVVRKLEKCLIIWPVLSIVVFLLLKEHLWVGFKCCAATSYWSSIHTYCSNFSNFSLIAVIFADLCLRGLFSCHHCIMWNLTENEKKTIEKCLSDSLSLA